jgi:hypothetical protein
VLENVPFDEEIAFLSLKKGASPIQIRNKIHDEEGIALWFRLSTAYQDKVLSMEWHNTNFDFLLGNERINLFLQSKNFIFGYCCDNDDRYEQSQEKKEYFVNTDPKDPYKVKKIEENIDTSKNWGRYEIAGGLQLMAAPLMWFGSRFYKIIPKERLFKFKYTSSVKLSFSEIISINLFDIYDLPAKPENRDKQKEFWQFFDFKSVIDHYKKEHEVDAERSFKDFILRMAKKKKE